MMKKIKHLMHFSLLLVFCNTTVFAVTQKANNNFLDPTEYLQNLTPDQAQALQQTAQERLNNLTPKQKQELVQMAQDYLKDISPAEKQALMESAKKNLNIITPEQKQVASQAAQENLGKVAQKPAASSEQK